MIAAIIVGEMCEHSTESYLSDIAELEVTNTVTISQFINASLNYLWPDGIKYYSVLLILTDAAAYIMCAGRDLNILLTCLAHGVQRIAEEVRKLFPKVNHLISNVKKIFLK